MSEEEEDAEMFEEEEEKDGTLEEDFIAGLGRNDDANFFLGKRYPAALERRVRARWRRSLSEGPDCYQPTFGPPRHAQVSTSQIQSHLRDATAAASPHDGFDPRRWIEREPGGLQARGHGDAELSTQRVWAADNGF